MRPIALLIALMLALLTPALAQAQAYPNFYARQDGCPADGGDNYMFLSEVIPLVEAIPEQTNAQLGVFYTHEVDLVFEDEMQVAIAEPNGQPFWSDDLLEIIILPLHKRWATDFRSPDRQDVMMLKEPQLLTPLLSPGKNTLQVTLENQEGFTRSASAIVLQIWKPCVSAEERQAAQATAKAQPLSGPGVTDLPESESPHVRAPDAPLPGSASATPASLDALVEAVAWPSGSLLWLGAPLGLLLLGIVWMGAQRSWRKFKTWLQALDD